MRLATARRYIGFMLFDFGQILLRPEQEHTAVPVPRTLVHVLFGRLNIWLFYKC